MRRGMRHVWLVYIVRLLTIELVILPVSERRPRGIAGLFYMWSRRWVLKR